MGPGGGSLAERLRSDAGWATYGRRVAAATITGVGAFVAGYAVAYLAKAEEAARRIGAYDAFVEELPSIWQGIGWVYFAMHNVPIIGTGVARVGGGGGSTEVTPDQFKDAWLLLVPMAVLVVAGFLLARLAGARRRRHGALAGATVLLGYLPLALAVIVFSRWSASVEVLGDTYDVTVGPELWIAVLVSVLYPLVFGALGGILAARRHPPSHAPDTS